MSITEQAFVNAAKKIGCELAAIKAVDEVESRGKGFLPDNFPKILFEPHIFWKELKKIGVTPVVSDICYPTWGTKPYGKDSDQPNRLERAAKINRDAALKSCSWGRFQICGFNYAATGCKTLQEFVNKMFKGEDEHLNLFVNYIIHENIDDELIGHDWAGFARLYNGPLYYKNQYDVKLKKAFEKHNKQ